MKPSLTRQSNFELLRIVCMLMIVCGHLCIANGPEFPQDRSLINFVRSFMMTAVNAFIILSGYFSIKYKFDRFMHLLFQTFFYSVVMFTITVSLGWHVINPIKDFLVLFPVFSTQYWFITAYLILYILAPFINNACARLSQNSYSFLLLIGFFAFYLWPTFSFLVNSKYIVADAGYGIVNFIYLYMLGRFLRLYYKASRNSLFYFTVYFLVCLALYTTHTLLSAILGFPFTSFYSYNTLFVFVGSIVLFLFFSKFSFQSRWVNSLAKSCLAVYLIHFGPHFWYAFCSKVLHFDQYQGWVAIPFLFVLPVLIYLACYVIENVRTMLLFNLEKKLIDSFSRTSVVKYLIYHYDMLQSKR